MTATDRFFAAAARISLDSRPAYVHTPPLWHSVARSVGYTPRGSLVFAGPGAQLAAFTQHMLDASQSDILKLSERRVWRTQQAALSRLLSEFFQRGEMRPAVFWCYSICLTDNCVARIRMGGQVVAPAASRSVGISEGDSMPLLFGAAHPPGGLWLDAEKLVWERPEGLDTRDTRLSTITERRRWVTPRMPLGSSFRQFSSYAGRGDEYLKLLQQGEAPVLAGRQFTMVDPDSSASTSSVEARPASESCDSGRDVDRGIINCNLLKAWTLDYMPILRCRKEPMVHELTIAIDRQSARMLFVTTTSSRYATQVVGERAAPLDSVWGAVHLLRGL